MAHRWGPDAEINGLALCTLHHKLFDRGAFTLADDLKIMVFVKWHVKEVFRGEYRELQKAITAIR
jgi:predicted restriction endonuclease